MINDFQYKDNNQIKQQDKINAEKDNFLEPMRNIKNYISTNIDCAFNWH